MRLLNPQDKPDELEDEGEPTMGDDFVYWLSGKKYEMDSFDWSGRQGVDARRGLHPWWKDK